MPSFDVAGARRAGYRDPEILDYLSGGANVGTLPGTDEEKIQLLLRLTGKTMLPVEYAPPPPAQPQLPAELGGPETPRLNPRTGLPMRETYVPVLDDPLIGATEVAGGYERLGGARTGSERAQALSDMVRGGMRASTPMLPTAFLAAPAATLGGLAYGTAAGLGTEGALAMFGAEPGYAALGGDIAGLLGGTAGAKLPWEKINLGTLTKRLWDLPAEEAGTFTPRGLTPEAVLEKADVTREPEFTFSEFTKENPEAGATMFDLANAQRAMPERSFQPERYIPARGTPARVAEALRRPTVLKNLKQLVEEGGEKLKGYWYRTGPLYDLFKRTYGEQAPKAYQQFMGIVASTSPRNPVPENIKVASYYNYLANQGLPLPTEAPASGYGNIAQKNHIRNVARILAQGQLDPLQNPKPYSFTENLLGNEMPVTIDTHNMRALGMLAKDPRFLLPSFQAEKGAPVIKPREMLKSGELTMRKALKQPALWASAPEPTEYLAYELAQQKMAKDMGISPAQFQERMWVGGGELTGLESPAEPFLRTVASRIHYTAARMNVKPEVVLKKFIKGEIPLL